MRFTRYHPTSPTATVDLSSTRPVVSHLRRRDIPQTGPMLSSPRYRGRPSGSTVPANVARISAESLRGHVPRSFRRRFSATPALWRSYSERVLFPITGEYSSSPNIPAEENGCQRAQPAQVTRLGHARGSRACRSRAWSRTGHVPRAIMPPRLPPAPRARRAKTPLRAFGWRPAQQRALPSPRSPASRLRRCRV